MFRRIFTLTIIGTAFWATSSLNAQTFEDFKIQIREKYNKFEEETQQKFDDFVTQLDKEFAAYLSENFSPYKVEENTSYIKQPKPVDPPVAETQEIVIMGDEIKYTPPRKSFTSQQGPILPAINKREATDFKTVSIDIDFLGRHLKIDMDEKIKVPPIVCINADEISNYWSKLSQTNYNHLIYQFSEAKRSLNLNDWAYYQLLKSFTEKLYLDNETMQAMLQWYLLTRCRYKSKIGYQGDKAFLLLPALYPIYNKEYLHINNVNYYIMSGGGGKISTYDKDFPETDILMDLRILKPFTSLDEPIGKPFQFSCEGTNYKLTLAYDPVMIQFYQTVPLSDVTIYFNSVFSDAAKNSVIKAFKPILEGKTAIQSANILLSFVQQAFEYKTDQQSQGHERYFFAEELFYYPFSDCEDRSILFSSLVKTLLKIDVIGLGFPGHMATAIHFDRKQEGDFLSLNGKEYVVADPTYEGAPIGILMNQVKGERAEIILVDSREQLSEINSEIWQLVNQGGGFKADILDDVVIDKDGNIYVCGYFVDQAIFGDIQLSSASNSRDLFIVKFNSNKETVWAKKAIGVGNDVAFSLAISPLGKLFMYGSLEGMLDFGAYQLIAENAPDVFVAQYNTNGDLVWAQKAGIDKLDHTSDFMFAARFNDKGEKTMAKLYSHAENFDHYGLTVDDSGNAIITGSFYATTGMNQHDFVNYDLGNDFNALTVLKTTNDELVQKNYEKTIAGLFAAMNLLKANTLELKGVQIQEVFDKHNPEFAGYAGVFYKSFGKMMFMKNNSGIIVIKTASEQPLIFDRFKVNDNARIKIIKYESGNVEVKIFSGIYVGSASNWLLLNSVKLFKSNGDLMLDFDDDHTTRKLNLKSEILKK